ncbi:DNA recombination protein RmuC [Ferrimonas sp. SCSIO 43195]|nr:DNA recombination protein RmuC [Ferrimonas sp. SCSIO 43195]USD38825.1 DNA recombination protein RmuC [Ferrimonas sp. SCSIO 43195]
MFTDPLVLAALGVTFLIAVAIGWLGQSNGRRQAEHRSVTLEATNEQLAEQLERHDNRLQHKEQELNQLHSALADSRAREESLRHQVQQALDSEKRLTLQFENLANRIFDNKSQQLSEQSQSQLSAVLTPLQQQLDGFRKQVQDSYTSEAKERFALKHQLDDLKAMNLKMSEDALNLTKALKGDNKAMGNWGEVVLARLLTQSGLREGHEYDTQAALKQDDGKRYQPDVIVHLPDDKDVVIDSKVSLLGYERFFNAEDDDDRQRGLRDHLASVRAHIKGLSDKDYQQLNGIRTLDYVLMFIPVEPGFLAAIESDPELVNFALERNILLTSPTNLMVALRTINNLWRFEYQSRNAQEIAAQAGKIYDKLVGFSDDLLKVGRALDTAQGSYQKALGKFSSGRGNLLRQAEQMKQLGATTSKQPQAALVDDALNPMLDHRDAVDTKE